MSLSIKQTAGILKKAGFKDAEIPIMVAIGMGESGLNPGAHNPKYLTIHTACSRSTCWMNQDINLAKNAALTMDSSQMSN